MDVADVASGSVKTFSLHSFVREKDATLEGLGSGRSVVTALRVPIPQVGGCRWVGRRSKGMVLYVPNHSGLCACVQQELSQDL